MKTALTWRRPWRWAQLFVLALGWHFGAFFLIQTYQKLVEPLVVAVWPLLFRNLQLTVGTAGRASFWFSTCLSTAPPLLFGLWWCRRQSPPETFRTPLPIAFAAWDAALVLIWGLSHEFGLYRAINRLDWYLFGPPELFGFRNLDLPIYIAWGVTTTPVVLAALAWNLPAVDPRNTSPSSRQSK